MKLKCSTCGISLAGQENFVRFFCPACGETEVVRCAKCKNQSVPYTCTCGFTGP